VVAVVEAEIVNMKMIIMVDITNNIEEEEHHTARMKAYLREEEISDLGL
jgi:hypothetical protein